MHSVHETFLSRFDIAYEYSYEGAECGKRESVWKETVEV